MRAPTHDPGQGARRICATCGLPLSIKSTGRAKKFCRAACRARRPSSGFRFKKCDFRACPLLPWRRATKPHFFINKIRVLQGHFGRSSVSGIPAFNRFWAWSRPDPASLPVRPDPQGDRNRVACALVARGRAMSTSANWGATRPKADRPVYTIQLRPTPQCADPIKALRHVLKYARRIAALECLDAREVRE
jgi:hypothetical protein